MHRPHWHHLYPIKLFLPSAFRTAKMVFGTGSWVLQSRTKEVWGFMKWNIHSWKYVHMCRRQKRIAPKRCFSMTQNKKMLSITEGIIHCNHKIHVCHRSETMCAIFWCEQETGSFWKLIVFANMYLTELPLRQIWHLEYFIEQAAFLQYKFELRVPLKRARKTQRPVKAFWRCDRQIMHRESRVHYRTRKKAHVKTKTTQPLPCNRSPKLGQEANIYSQSKIRQKHSKKFLWKPVWCK